MKKLFTVVLFTLVLSQWGLAQGGGFMRPHEWKKFKKEIFFSMGTSAFMGDLGGTDRTGKDYSPADLNLSQNRSAFGIGARYRFHKYLCTAAKFNYLIVKGDDRLTANAYRNNRNLNFRSNIFELSARIEAGTQRIKRGGGHYGVQRNTARTRNISHGIYGFIGIGVFYFNPYGKTPDGRWVALKPLHTEGQGLPGGPKQYKNFSISIPVGGYYKFTLKKIWSLGVELSYRKTFTDYIDDVGSVYYNKNLLAQAYGADSYTMSDPSKGNIYGATSPDAAGRPAQRGDNQKDIYLSLEVTLGYIFKQQRKSARLRSKF